MITQKCLDSIWLLKMIAQMFTDGFQELSRFIGWERSDFLNLKCCGWRLCLSVVFSVAWQKMYWWHCGNNSSSFLPQSEKYSKLKINKRSRKQAKLTCVSKVKPHLIAHFAAIFRSIVHNTSSMLSVLWCYSWFGRLVDSSSVLKSRNYKSVSHVSVFYAFILFL